MDRNTIAGFLAILFWSSTVALARSISEQVGPVTAGASVYLCGGVMLIVYQVAKDKRFDILPQARKKYIIGCGMLFVIYTIALFLGLGLSKTRQQSVEVGLINYLWPSLTIVFSLVLLSKRAKMGLIPGIIAACIGIVLVLTHQSNLSWHVFVQNLSDNPASYGLGLLAAVCWALYSTLARKWSDSESKGAVPVFILITGMVLQVLCLIYPENSVWKMHVILEILFLGLSTALAYVFWDLAMRKGNMVVVVAGSYLTPFFSTLISCIYLQVVPGIKLWIGCALIILGSVLSFRSVYDKDSSDRIVIPGDPA